MPAPKRSLFVPMDTYEGEHRSFEQSIEGLHRFKTVPTPRTGVEVLKTYNQATKELQGMISEALAGGKELRALGSSWSLSKCGMARHRLIESKALRNGFVPAASQVAAAYGGDRTRLRFLECGFSIAAINRALFDKGLSLKASGSNNGQTLAGVISTGTHGSAFKFGATQDMVVGLHLITGPNKHVYLQRKTRPVVKKAFSDKIGADLVEDDALFEAALVSFGSFGIIKGTMVETRELFALHAYRSTMKLNAGLRKAISALDFSGIQLPRAESKLYHFEVFYNPNEGAPPKEAIVLLMFEGKLPQNYRPPDWDDGSGDLSPSGLEVMGELIGLIPSQLTDAVKPILNQQVRDKFAPYQKTGTIRDLFRGEKVRGKNMACGVGLPLDRSWEALNVAFETYEDFGSVLPLLLSTRYVKGTRALLGFTRFDPTCVLEIDAVNTAKTRKYLEKVWANLAAAGIPFTLHWGKLNGYLNAARVKGMYGDNVKKWKESREALLESPAVARVFENDFLRRCGLAS